MISGSSSSSWLLENRRAEPELNLLILRAEPEETEKAGSEPAPAAASGSSFSKSGAEPKSWIFAAEPQGEKKQAELILLISRL